MTDEYKEIHAEFDVIKELARGLKPMPDKLERSTACVAAYHTLRAIYVEQHLRIHDAAELTARGRLARGLFIKLRRAETRLQKAAGVLHERHMRAATMPAKLIGWSDADGDTAAMLDVLQDYIHALTGEDSPVTAGKICDALRRVLLRSQASPEGTPKKAAARFKPPTIEEVREYWKEKGLKGDPDAFWYHFDAVHWKRGRDSIRNWKSAAQSWSRREKEFEPQTKKMPGETESHRRLREQQPSVFSSDASYDLEAYRRTAVGLRHRKEETA